MPKPPNFKECVETCASCDFHERLKGCTVTRPDGISIDLPSLKKEELRQFWLVGGSTAEEKIFHNCTKHDFIIESVNGVCDDHSVFEVEG
jgi:hypothetical protein